MNELHKFIVSLIEADGPLSLARYMELCLGHPHYGYYMTRDPFGQQGDFITAPEISQMFGELIGVWCANTWIKMGRPSPCAVVELGPGRGTLMVDALRAIRKVSGMAEALSITLVETSPVLRQSQKKLLNQAEFSIQWTDSISNLPKIPLLLIANEFFDALPLHQYIRMATGWHERLVGIDESNHLQFGLSPEPITRFDRAAPIGSVFEEARASSAYVEQIARHVRTYQGAALIIDYGHIKSGFGDTLQAVKHHGFINPLSDPGDADLTVHVDFEAIGRIAKQAGVTISGPVTQRDFLLALGLAARATRLTNSASPEQALAIQGQFERLTGQSGDGMGTLFKVISLHHPHLEGLAGF